MAISWGLSYGHHDAAVVVFRDDHLVLAHRARAKDLDNQYLQALEFAYPPEHVYVHENKKRDLWRKIKTGDWGRLYARKPWLPIKPVYGNHHLSHAAAAYYTSCMDNAIIIVADAIGEQECLAVYHATNGQLNTEPLHVQQYPHSLGLFYSHHAARIGLEPNSQERVMMAMSKLGKPTDQSVMDSYSVSMPHFNTKFNMHRYPKDRVINRQQKWDIAATAQKALEDYLVALYQHFSVYSTNLVFTGGVAYNSFIVNRLKAHCIDMYVPSHPGDAGSAYGAILQHTHCHMTLPKNRMYE